MNEQNRPSGTYTRTSAYGSLPEPRSEEKIDVSFAIPDQATKKDVAYYKEQIEKGGGSNVQTVIPGKSPTSKG